MTPKVPDYQALMEELREAREIVRDLCELARDLQNNKGCSCYSTGKPCERCMVSYKQSAAATRRYLKWIRERRSEVQP